MTRRATTPLARHVASVAVCACLIGAAVLLARQASSTAAAVGVGLALSAIGGSAEAILYVLARRELSVTRNVGRVREYGQSVSIYDKDSGLYADWYFGLRLEEEIARSQRYRQSFTLLLIEDTGGYLGETVKRLVFQALDDAVRNTDIVAHLTDKRFAVLLTNTDAGGALIAADRVRESLPLSTVRVGLASYPVDGRDAPTLLAAAGASPAHITAITRGTRKGNTKLYDWVRTEGFNEADPETQPGQSEDASPEAQLEGTPAPGELESNATSNVIDFPSAPRICGMPGCERPHHARNLCARHYAQSRNQVA